MILAVVSSFQVCKLRCKILISGSALSGGRLPRSLRNVSLLGIFLLFCLQVSGFALSSRFAGCFYARFWHGSIQGGGSEWLGKGAHHMAHGLDDPQGRTCNLPCREKALESLPRCSFPDRMCANQQPRRRTGAVFIWPPERSLERGACV